MMTHPASDTRDTQQCLELKHKYPGVHSLALKSIVKTELGIDIQRGEHDSVCIFVINGADIRLI